MIKKIDTNRLGLNYLTLCLCLFFLSGCAATVKVDDPALQLDSVGFQTEKNYTPEAIEPVPGEKAPIIYVDDPWESMNRSIYGFNAEVDRLILLPATEAYEILFPEPVRGGIDNAIANLNEFGVFVNSVLQGRVQSSFVTLYRFVINSTIGLAGIFDVASHNEGLQPQKADFGQTLGVWGVSDGPYLVVPLFGPSNVRDTFGLAGDIAIQTVQMNAIYDEFSVSDDNVAGFSEVGMGMTHIVEGGLRTLSLRSNTPFRYRSTGSPFEYELVRFLFTKKRELDVEFPHSEYDK